MYRKVSKNKHIENLQIDGDFTFFDVLEFFFRDQGYDPDTAFDKAKEVVGKLEVTDENAIFIED